MTIDIGFPPVITFFIALFALSLFVDYLLELFSVRLTLASGRWQQYLFHRLGQTHIIDGIASLCYQLLSFRKRSYFQQMLSFVSTGSFHKRQIFSIFVGAIIGIAFSMLVFHLSFMPIALALLVIGFVLSLVPKEQLKDLGVACFSLGMVLALVLLFEQGVEKTNLNVHAIHLGPLAIIGVTFLSSILFRTPLPFLIMMSGIHFLFGLNIWLFPVLISFHWFVYLLGFYRYFLVKRSRMRPALIAMLVFQCFQLIVAYGVLAFFSDFLQPLSHAESFLESLLHFTSIYSFYFLLPAILSIPLLWLLYRTSLFRSESKKEPQHILNLYGRSQVYSLHLSLFLLRQEFIKYVTLVHTLFKLSREAEDGETEIDEKLGRYRRILLKVSEEIKELCFSVGRQRAYRWHVQEILVFYKAINQIELMVDDLSEVLNFLQKNDLDPEWEKECRFWLSLQLLVFESYFNFVIGVDSCDLEKVANNTQKSYDVLDRLFSDQSLSEPYRNFSKTFYRITESNGGLSTAP